MKAILAAVAVALATPAIAARCPHGQILRVSLTKCVDVHSKLAAGYVHVSRAHTRVVISLPPARPLINDGVYYLPVEAEVLRERLARPTRELTRDEILLSRAAALAP
jgi:hypothetical protein